MAKQVPDRPVNGSKQQSPGDDKSKDQVPPPEKGHRVRQRQQQVAARRARKAREGQGDGQSGNDSRKGFWSR